jgi:hypothetical protein
MEEVSKTFFARHGIDYVQMSRQVLQELRQTTQHVDPT